LTDVAVVCVAQNCRKIMELDVCACGKISELSLQCLAQYSRLLKSLDVTNCPAVVAGAVEHFKVARPGCEVAVQNYSF
jgi:hypothetical protein